MARHHFSWLMAAAIGLCVAGCGVPSFLVTPVSSHRGLDDETLQEGKGFSPSKIVIIPVEGMLVNAREGGLLGAQENPVSLIAQQLKRAEEDSSVAAVVLRINSPGGTVTASDTLYQLVQDFRTKTHKPVIASTLEMAASGGFYVACASDKIVAQPTSVVGSIGVIFTTFDVEGTLGKIGARTYTIKSAEMKDMGSPFKALTNKERAVLQAMIDEYFHRFEGVVASNRKLDAAGLAKVNDGRIFTGQQAYALGLVDQLGGLQDAIELAKKQANVPNAKVVLYIRPYGYGGSIYATNQVPAPESQAAKTTTQLQLPGFHEALPPGFYYIWQ